MIRNAVSCLPRRARASSYDIKILASQKTCLSFGPRWASSSTSASSPLSPAQPKKSWSDTLLLPRTSFPMKQNDPVAATKSYESSTTTDLYAHQWEDNQGPVFILHDGPPYANGELHMGHAMNKILKDFINRYKVMRGFKVHYVPGWDCHGLPIEHKVLKEMGSSHLTLPPLKIRGKARESALSAISLQLSQFLSMGIMAPWNTPSGTYRTMDHTYEIRQLHLLRQMLSKGLISYRKRPGYWSASSRTALAEAELSYVDDFESRSVYVWFRVKEDGMSEGLSRVWKEVGKEKELGLTIWTTTAWTLPANQAVAVGKDLVYCLVEIEGQERISIIAKERLEPMTDVLGSIRVLAEISGTDLLGTEYDHLFCNPDSESGNSPQIIPSKYVTTQAGTGLVHSAPGHGQEDYEVYRAAFTAGESGDSQPTELRCPVDDEGKITSEVIPWAKNPSHGERLVGKDVFVKFDKGKKDGGAVGEMIKILEEEGVLLKEQVMQHRYPCDWKTKEPVIVRATPQWFANVDAVKADAVAAMDSINFKPEQSRRRLEAFVLGRSEWCISRQRSWGVPIPVLHDVESGEVILTQESMKHIIPVLESKGIDSWWSDDVDEFVPPSLRDSGRMFRKGTDTMDVWFDSGSSWTLLRELGLRSSEEPWADVYLEGSDQHRGWFQSSLLTSLCSEDGNGEPRGRTPYKNLITHGFILDEEGKKMSKSIGNVISPTEVINGGKDRKKQPRYGTDLLRLWAASVEYTKDAHIGPTALAQAAEQQRKLRNVLKYLLSNSRREGMESIPLHQVQLELVDRYVLHELAMLEKVAMENYDSYQFNRVIQEVGSFTANVLSSFYFEVGKDTLYADEIQNERRQAVVAVLAHVLDRLRHVLNPLVPYLTAEISHHLCSPSPSVNPSHPLTISDLPLSWSEQDYSPWIDSSACDDMNLILGIRTEVLGLLEKARGDKVLRGGVEAGLRIDCKEKRIKRVLEDCAPTLPAIFGVSKVYINGGASGDHSDSDKSTWTYTSDFNIADILDIPVRIEIFPSPGCKCPRCWLHVGEVEGELCVRCEEVVSGL